MAGQVRASGSRHLTVEESHLQPSYVRIATCVTVVRPLWWHCPLDPICLVVADAFMLGNVTLVAPVLRSLWTARDIYLPQGRWKANGGGLIYEGPIWLHGYRVPLGELPTFDLLSNSSQGE